MELSVEAGEAGTRLDVLLVQRVDGMSRASARRLIQDGLVRLNGRHARKGSRLNEGDRISVEEMPPPKDFVARPAPALPLDVRLETDSFVVVDKPAGQPTHPLRPDEQDTLANALLARYPEMERVGYALREPGIVHRLDNETSGLVLAARSHRAFDALRELLKAGGIDKRYLAMVDGHVDAPKVIDAPIATHPGDPRRVHVCLDPLDRRLPAARRAVTYVETARPIGDRTLIEVRAPVAVRHQIRAHLAALGHPLVGDWLYGGPADWLGRHFLHASRIAFVDPIGGGVVDVESALPEELASLTT